MGGECRDRHMLVLAYCAGRMKTAGLHVTFQITYNNAELHYSIVLVNYHCIASHPALIAVRSSLSSGHWLLSNAPGQSAVDRLPHRRFLFSQLQPQLPSDSIASCCSFLFAVLSFSLSYIFFSLLPSFTTSLHPGT